MDMPSNRQQLTERVLVPANSWKGIKSQIMILERSVDFIAKRSASRITLQAVADDLEISKGAIQAHFKTSDILMASILFYILKANLETLVTKLDEAEGNFSRALFNVIESQMDWAVSKYNIAQLDIRFCARGHHNLENAIKQVLISTRKLSHSILVRGMNLDGEFYKNFLIFREALILNQNNLGAHAMIFHANMPALGIRSLDTAKAKAAGELKQLHQALWASDGTEPKEMRQPPVRRRRAISLQSDPKPK